MGYNYSAPRLPKGLAFSSYLKPVVNRGQLTSSVLVSSNSQYSVLPGQPTWPFQSVNNLANSSFLGLR